MVDCSELSKTITQIALSIGSRPEIKSIDHVVTEMQKEVPQIDRQEIVRAIVEATTGKAHATTELQKKLNDLKREAKNDVGLRAAIMRLQEHLSGETLPTPRTKPGAPPEPIADLRTMRDSLLSAIRKSDPAIKQRFEKQISELSERIANNDYAPRVHADEVPMSKELQTLQYTRDRLRSQINQNIRELEPKTVFGRATGAMNAARTIMTTGEFSFILRQGGATALSHPIRTIGAAGDAFRAFASDQYTHRMEQAVFNHPDAPIARKAGLALIDPGTVLSGGEKAYASGWANKIPGIKNFSRSGEVFLNKIRMDTFSALKNSLARNGEPTLAEAKALATYVNESTGHGTLGGLEKAASTLNTIFFSPRYVASRFQYLSGHSLWGGSGRTRALIAKEYAKTAVGLGVVYALGAAAGGTIEKDPRSSDFGKIKFGNTRLDPLSGLAQVSTFIARMATRETKNSSGKIIPLTGPKVPYKGDTPVVVATRFARSKLAPVPGAIANLEQGEDMVGNPTSVGGEAMKLAYPITYQDVYQAVKDQGVPAGTAQGLLTVLGMGLQTYKKQTPAERRAAQMAR